MIKNTPHRSLEDLREGKTVVDGCPVQYVREARTDGTGLFLGSVSVTRNGRREMDGGGRGKGSQRRVDDGRRIKAQPTMRHIGVTFRRLFSAQPPRQGDNVRSNAVMNQWMIKYPT